MCYSVGPVAVDGHDVVSARVSTTPSDGIGVDITLTPRGLEGFNALAAQLVALAAPNDEIAMIVDGQIRSVPRFNTGHYDTPEIRIAGSFSTEAEAQRVAAAVGPTTAVKCMVGEPDEAARFRAMTVPEQQAYIAACRSAQGQYAPGQSHTPPTAPAPGSNPG